MKKYCSLFLLLALSVHTSLSQNISFADPVVKSLCVAKWDTNGDGELNVEEASKVVSLGTTFRANTNIKLFHELRFFTGLTKIDDYAFYQSGLKELSLPSSVSEIGLYAFSLSSIGPSFVVPGHVKTIGENAFSQCYGLSSVTLEEGVETLGALAFKGPLINLFLPSTIQYIGHQVVRISGGTTSDGDTFYYPDESLYIYEYAKNPPSIHANAFVTLFGDGFLIVPFGSKQLYQSNTAWNRFIKIYEFGDVNMDGVINISDVVALVDFILGNKPKRFNSYMADVNADKTINISDAVAIVKYILGD